MKSMRFVGPFLLATALVSGCSNTADTPTEPELSSAALGVSAEANGGKVAVCHATGNGTFNAVSVGANALNSHLAHGDALAQLNAPVPGNSGAVFDANCGIVSWAYAANVAPDAAAQNGPELFVGDGIPATNFGTARNEAAGIELGLMVLYREGPTIASVDNYNDDVLNFAVASGPQSTFNGSNSSRTDRAAWNFTFSVATGLNGATTDLTGHTFQLLIDMDPSAGTNYATLTLEAGPSVSGFVWREAVSNAVVIGDDEGNVNVTQNSQNYAFYSAFTSPYVPPLYPGQAKFDIILQALDGAQVIARNHIAVNVAP